MGKNKFIIRLLILCTSGVLSAQDNTIVKADEIVLKANNHYRIQVASGEAAEFTCQTLKLRMSFDSKVVSLKDISEDKELLDKTLVSPGFYMTFGGNQEISFTKMFKIGEKEYMVTSENEDQQLKFTVSSGEKYLTFQINELVGIPKTVNYTIYFNLFGNEKLRVVPLDYMTFVKDDRLFPVKWPSPWIRGKGIPNGGFAIYYDSSDEEEDDILAHIWANENLPHPNIKDEWNVARVKKWVADWVKLFSDRSTFWYSHPKDPGEIDRIMPYLRKMGIKEFHIYHWTWLDNRHHCWVQKNEFFPNGREDLVKFAKRLLKDSIRLTLHYNFCEIPLDDPVFVGTKPNEGLASWGKGKLYKSISENDSTILFAPQEGTYLPFRSIGNGYGEHPPALLSHIDFRIIQIGDEIIRFKNASNTNGDVWVLTGCKRGLGSTLPAAHSEKADIKGLVSPYGLLFVPDTYSPLFDTMVNELVSLWNEAKIYNITYDGSNADYLAGACGTQYRKWLGQAYSGFDHPVWFETGHGVQRWGHFEYWFNSTKKCEPVHLGFRGDMGVRPRTWSISRPAATIAEAHVRMSQVAATNGNDFSLSLPLHYPSDWEHYGRMDELCQVVTDWKAVNKKLSDEQRTRIKATLYPPLIRGYLTDIVWDLRKGNGLTKIYPQKNPLTRRTGDVMWGQNDGEVGWITPHQYIRNGETLELENPYKGQPLQFVIDIMTGTSYESKNNIPLFEKSHPLINLTEMTIKREGDAIDLSYNNQLPDNYNQVLLARVDNALDLKKHRPIGMWVTGDGSNAIFLIRQARKQDYAVKLDFVGKKYVEIPNAIAYWNQAEWGGPGHSGDAYYDYDPKTIDIGFGRIPGKTNVHAKVEGIKALTEKEVVLHKLKISIDGTSSLIIQGYVRSYEYVEYLGGNKVTIYDRNWHKLREISVIKENYVIPNGYHKVTVSSEKNDSKVWMTVRFITEGEPIVVTN